MTHNDPGSDETPAQARARLEEFMAAAASALRALQAGEGRLEGVTFTDPETGDAWTSAEIRRAFEGTYHISESIAESWDTEA